MQKTGPNLPFILPTPNIAASRKKMDRKKKKGRKESVPMEVMLMNGRGNEGKRTEKTAEKRKNGLFPFVVSALCF